MRKSDWRDALRCPRCETLGLIVPNGEDDPLPRRGEATCNACHARFAIREHVLDLHAGASNLTMAGRSNFLPWLPWAYENIWRPRALSLLTGEHFPVTREIQLVNDWLNLQPGAVIVDLGSSTDLYARGIARRLTSDAPTVIAIDIAPGMLKAGREYANRAGIHNIAHVRALAEHLPFANASIDALVCGGSLNEFRSMQVALREARRVCVPHGRMLAMSLLAATFLGGKVGQLGARLSGIQFPSLTEFYAHIHAAGWRCVKQVTCGVVAFTLLEPHEEKSP